MTSYSNFQLNNRTNGQRRQLNYRGKENSSSDFTHVNYNNDISAEIHHDPNSNVTFHQRSALQHQIPPPVSTNMHLLNSPSTPLRRLHSTADSDDDFHEIYNKKKKKRKQKQNGQFNIEHDNQNANVNRDQTSTIVMDQPEQSTTRTTSLQNAQQTNSSDVQKRPQITNESARYALTRFPFPPYVMHFNSGNVTPNQVKEELCNYVKLNHQVVIEIVNCRRSNTVYNNNGYDILLYLKDAISFSFLLDVKNWPPDITKEKFMFSSSPSIPPQLCLIIKNVDLQIDFDDFSDDLKTTYPEIKNVIRMKNKFQNNIKLVKIELTSSAFKQQLLSSMKLTINHIVYDIDEYLAPANVLICSKCMGIGHFKKQCLQSKETCKTCGEQCGDLKLHNCSQVEKCIHCQQNHKSNALKCPVIKNFRAELTRKLLNNRIQPTRPPPSTTYNNNGNNFSWGRDALSFPPLNQAQVPINNPMINKLDDLLSKMVEVKDHLAKLSSKHEKFEAFMLEKSQNDDRVKQNLQSLLLNDNELKKDIVQHDLIIKRHENMFTKVIFPIFEDILTFIAAQNYDKKGNPLDADLRSRLDRYRVQVKKASEVIQTLS